MLGPSANHLGFIVFKSIPEVRALPSPGVTRLRRYYDPVRLPPWPPPKSASRPLPSPRRVSPVTCSTFPTCHAQYPGGPQRGHLPVTSPLRAAFPDPVAPRHPRLHFRGLLRLHIALRPAGLLSRPRRPLSQGSGPASYPTEPLVSYQSYRLLSGWILPPLVLHAFGTHTGSPGHGPLLR